MKFQVANVKCEGCAANIRDGLASIDGVSKVSVDVSCGEVEVLGGALIQELLTAKLAALGYPLVND